MRKKIELAIVENPSIPGSVVFMKLQATKLDLPEYPFFDFYIHREHTFNDAVPVLATFPLWVITEMHCRMQVCTGFTKKQVIEKLKSIISNVGKNQFSEIIQNKKAEAELLAKQWDEKKKSL